MNPRNSTMHSLRPGLVVAITLLVGACGKSPPPAPTPTDQPAPAPTDPAASNTPPPIVAADESESPDRPRVLLWVEGSPEEDTIWRGWPVLVRVQTLTGDPPADVQMRGSTSVTLTRAGVVWLIPPAATAPLTPGSYTLSAGDQQIAVVVTDPPRELTTGQQSMRSRLLVQSALASGDTAAAQQAADAWVQAAPNAFEAREAQGDVLRARGDSDGALDAYNAAVQRVPRGIDPPPASLHAKVTALLRERAASLSTRPAAAPSVDEVSYYEIIDAGDKALAAGDRAAASQRYAEADAFRRTRALTVSSLELDDKRVALGTASAAPARESGPKPTPAQSGVVAAPPPANPSSSAATDAGPAPGTIIPSSELADAAIIADSDGQWAASARASSEYGTPRYGAGQATGVPNIPLGMAGDNPDAWCPAAKDEGSAWLELTFANPVHATEVRVRQNNAPGAIAKIEVITPDGTAHVWWEGVDPFVAPAIREIAWFAVRVPRTDTLVAKVKLTLNLATVPGWNQIDAVQLVGGGE